VAHEDQAQPSVLEEPVENLEEQQRVEEVGFEPERHGLAGRRCGVEAGVPRFEDLQRLSLGE
jgi:hypothetical protein